MTDLHTHILPGMDDGSPNTETSIAMLRAERDQGISTVVLTSHFYRSHERPSSFLKRRAAAMDQLQQAIEQLPQKERDSLPRLVLGLLDRGEGCGFELISRLEERGCECFRQQEAAIYPILHFLERKGLVRSCRRERDGGRSRRCYRLTARGVSRLKKYEAQKARRYL